MKRCATLLLLMLSSFIIHSCRSRQVACDCEGEQECSYVCRPHYHCVWHCEMIDTVYKKKRCYRRPQPYQKCICRYEPIYDDEGCCVSYEPKFIYETRYRYVPVYYFTNVYDRSPHYFQEVFRTLEYECQ